MLYFSQLEDSVLGYNWSQVWHPEQIYVSNIQSDKGSQISEGQKCKQPAYPTASFYEPHMFCKYISRYSSVSGWK